ncbi:MAG TPA: cysteine desulfurase NifS [Clostridiales bacterium]|nr:cysteine desulfurase NifS [Clostridiales bacterium]
MVLNKRIYMDHAATTPVKKEVLEEMLPYFTENFGNPSSVHAFGRRAREAMDLARERVANALNASVDEIYFTSGGSESDNWAIKGVALANKEKGNHIITTQIEHHAVLHACQYLEKHGFKVTYLPVDKYGLVTEEQVLNAITEKTILVTIMFANNEIGTIQPIKEIAKVVRDKGIYFHTDAVQALGSVPIDVKDLDIDLLSLSGHKIYGPKGVGVLYIKKGVKIDAVLHGGAQESNRRAGTENVPGIVGMGKAVELACNNLDKRIDRLTRLRDRLIDGIMSKIPHTILNGHRQKRLPGNVNICFEYIEGESLLLSLDLEGIACSSGSACTSGSLEPSHVLLALGLPHEIAHGSLRLTLGDDNTREDVDYVLEKLPIIVNRLREMSPLFAQEKGGMKNV